MENKQKFTINDVAKISGFSKATISRAINDSKEIKKETKEKILKLIRKLNYEPSNIARSLTKRSTNTIGVILEDILNPFYTEVAKEIEITLRKHGFLMFLMSSDWIYEEELKMTKTLIGNEVDGILITPINEDSETIKILESKGVPFIVINYKPKTKNFCWVSSDNIQGGYLATNHLISMGHKNILHIKGFNHQTTNDRLIGFKKAINENKSQDIQYLIEGDARSFDDGFKIMDKILSKIKKENMPTAVFAANDFIALGAMEAIFKKGFHIPEDFSIVGYDDIDLAGKVRVPLTTIHQSRRRMANIATIQLLDKIAKGEEGITRQFLMKPNMVLRESTKRI